MKDIRVILFSVIGSAVTLMIGAWWIETGSLIQALLLLAQIIGVSLIMIGIFFFFMAIGHLIFKDK